MSKPTAAEPAANAKTKSTGSGLINKFTVLGLILAVIIGECVAAFIFLGKGTEATAADAEVKEKAAAGHHAEEKHGGDHGKSAKPAAHGSHGSHGSAAKHDSGHGAGATEIVGEHREVDLGEYSIMATDPASSTMLLVDFHIFGTVAGEDAGDFETLYEENRNRVRHQVIIIVRSAEMTDLTDASLGLIRRQILEKTNQLLGKPLVQEIIFSKFSFIEQ